MHDRRVMTRVRGEPRSGPSHEHVTDWPLDTLVAYLFEGRECDEVRAILARGQATARGTQLSWDPVTLSVDEFQEIESRFPQGASPRALDRRHAVSVALTMPAMHPTLSVPIRADHPLVAEAAKRAAYLRFDYGPWADVFLSTLTRAEAAELLDDPARRSSDDGEAELAKRVLGEDDAALQFVVPRAESPPPWAAHA